MHFLSQPGKCVGMSGCMRQKEWQGVAKMLKRTLTSCSTSSSFGMMESSSTLSLQRQNKDTREHEIQLEYLQFI